MVRYKFLGDARGLPVFCVKYDSLHLPAHCCLGEQNHVGDRWRDMLSSIK